MLFETRRFFKWVQGLLPFEKVMILEVPVNQVIMSKYSNLDPVMEAEDHFKGGASSKSWKSRKKQLRKTKILVTIITCMLLCGIAPIKAQQTNDAHLEPVRGTFEGTDRSFEYYSIVRKLLFDGLSDNPEIRFFEMPSFSAENVLDITFDRNKKEYYLVYHISEENIWYASKREAVKVIKFKTEIDEESVELLKTLFFIATSQVRYPPPPVINADGSYQVAIVKDGTRYYFTAQKYNQKRTGMTHSPGKGSKMRKLVDIGYKLVELAKSGKDLVSINEPFKKEIEELTKELSE